MSTHSHASAHACAHCTKLNEHISSHAEYLEQIRAYFNQLSALYGAVHKFADHPNRVQELASLGEFLAADWADLVERLLFDGSHSAVSVCDQGVNHG